MSSHALKFFILSSLGLSCFFGNSAAFAQVDNSGGVVVPTDSTGSPTPTNTPVPIDTSTGTPTSPTADGTRFSCQINNGQHTVMYQPQSQPGQYFAWAAPALMGGNWPAEKRCLTIAQRLELYRPDGLQELQVARQNNENIVCVTTEANSSCRIVLTVPRDKDPYTVRNSIFQNLTTADSGQQTIAVNTYRNNQSGLGDLYNLTRTALGGNRVSNARSGINLKPFLDRKDGGTGNGLKNGVALRTRSTGQTNVRQPNNNLRLNPDRFRR
jgi:Circadian oscillating protein COP23